MTFCECRLPCQCNVPVTSGIICGDCRAGRHMNKDGRRAGSGDDQRNEGGRD